MSTPDIDEADVLAVSEVIRSGQLARGARAEEFERLVADYVGVKHAVATSSGTAALHLLVRGLGIARGDEVLVPSYTFCASVNAILYEGATPVFVDIESKTYCLDVEDAERRVTPRTRAIMVVDVFGHMADWEGVLCLARRHRLTVIGDACEALGAESPMGRAGSLGDGAALAFYPNKQITTGEGGMLVTSNTELARRARSMRNHGRGAVGFDPIALGFNYSMDEMSAALGASQMRRIDDFLARREAVATMYDKALLPLVARVSEPHVRSGYKMSWFVYVVTLADGVEREPVMRAMERMGVSTRGYFSPLHVMPYLQSTCGLRSGSLPVTESVARRTIALPFHNRMTHAEVDAVVAALREAVDEVRA